LWQGAVLGPGSRQIDRNAITSKPDFPKEGQGRQGRSQHFAHHDGFATTFVRTTHFETADGIVTITRHNALGRLFV
jgi:hypothetical protein